MCIYLHGNTVHSTYNLTRHSQCQQLREAMGSILMHSSVHGIPLNMGVNTEFGGLESPWAHPPVRMFNSSISTMNKPSLLQQNSNASASSSFQPPQVPAPTRWQSTLQDKVHTFLQPSSRQLYLLSFSQNIDSSHLTLSKLYVYENVYT